MQRIGCDGGRSSAVVSPKRSSWRKKKKKLQTADLTGVRLYFDLLELMLDLWTLLNKSHVQTESY